MKTQPTELFEIDAETGKLTLNFHSGQTKAWDSDKRFVLMLAGTQGGKTSFGPWWLWREIQKKGRGDYLAITTSYDLFILKMLPELRKVFEGVLRIGRWWGGYKVIELCDPETGKFLANFQSDEMWGRIILRSANAESGLEASTAKAAWLDECGQDEWTIDAWEAILRRLSVNHGRVLGTTTPYNVGWLKTHWYDLWRAGDPDYEVVRFSSNLNPAFPQDEYERAKRTMAEWRFKMFYDADFTVPEGLIYGIFRDEWYVDNFTPPPEWERIIGLDFGGANTAIIWLAEDASKTPSLWYIYDEYLGGNKPTSDHVNYVLSKLHREDVIKYTVVGGAASETQPRMDWADSGLTVYRPYVSDVESGISAVLELMKTGRLRVMKRCEGIRNEISIYHRRLDGNGVVTDVIENKEMFHRLDALRYAATMIAKYNQTGGIFA
jgi:hypothetical protein